MSTLYGGQTNNIVFAGAVAIASSTNANPIVVTTSADHNLTTGDVADIYDHAVNTNANGEWVVTVLTATTFSIATAGNGVGGATGSVQPLSCGAPFQIPADGDAMSAASVNVAFETLGDRTALLSAATGSLKLANTKSTQIFPTLSSVTPAVWASLAVNGTPAAWAPLKESGVVVPVLTVHDIQAADYIDYWITTSYFLTFTVTSLIRISLGYSLDPPPASSPTPTPILGSGQSIQVQGSGVVVGTMHLHGIITNASQAGTLNLYVGVEGYTGASVTVTLADEYFVEAKVFRTTGFPQ